MTVVAAVGTDLGMTPAVAVRVNPDFELKASGMRMGGGAQQFGIDAEQVPAVLRRLRELGLAFRGFHIYAGSQNLRADLICETQRRTVALALDLAASAFPTFPPTGPSISLRSAPDWPSWSTPCVPVCRRRDW
jgi:diaminopimelate decarboxylase